MRRATYVFPGGFAIKLLNAAAPTDSEVFQRFRREAEIASSIGHDNITQVFDFDHTPEGTPFMVMEHLQGEDLEQRLNRVGRIELPEMMGLLEQVASGLEAAHERGVVHRDLKPANLFLCSRSRGGDRLKILDFGISKISTSSSLATRTGAIMGTPRFSNTFLLVLQARGWKLLRPMDHFPFCQQARGETMHHDEAHSREPQIDDV